MFKLDVDLDLSAEEITEGLQENLNASVASTANKVGQEAKVRASQNLKSGLGHWEKGFSVDKVGEGLWILSVSGKLATMMEEGFGVGEIKKLLLNGNRYAHNKSQGKDYVDVPITMDPDAAVQRAGVTMEQFTSMDDVVKFINTSDWAKGGVKKEKRITQRVKDVIRSREESGAEKFLTIRRVTPDSTGWPENRFNGAKILESMDVFIERAFVKSLKEIF
ncbi:MAG: hypothetical protein GWN01_15325 [Nitrosopumilaceae archaeon]|nr:hypothetical protein [Nitrosopumilaceae archaeon]NIU87497.1 hypothetical protein [Nitrosopumilaceae archaeon]NIX62814.1 hypothetical protein [Nitrosopumilaceae archaeon]